MFNSKFLILFSLLGFLGCVTQPKVERDAHGSIIREDQFAEDKLYKKRAEEARIGDSYGVSPLSKNCTGIPLIGDPKDGFGLFKECKYELLARIKIQCEFSQVVGQPFYRPVRYKEFRVDIVGVDKSGLKDPKRFPTNVTTDHDGILDFSFGVTDSLNEFQFEIIDPNSLMTVRTNKISEPIIAPESFCSKK